MKQIIQSYKAGDLEVVDVPKRSCGDNGALAQTNYSLILAGTEKMLTDIGKESMISKAKVRPDLVKQVINMIKKRGTDFHCSESND